MVLGIVELWFAIGAFSKKCALLVLRNHPINGCVCNTRRGGLASQMLGRIHRTYESAGGGPEIALPLTLNGLSPAVKLKITGHRGVCTRDGTTKEGVNRLADAVYRHVLEHAFVVKFADT